MKILIVNPILYTCESKKVFKQDSIKDTMIFGLCQEFARQGHEVTLYACEDYRPLKEDAKDFTIVYGKPIFPNFFPPNSFPVFKGLKHFLKNNYFDVIICSEAFSSATYTCVKMFPKKTIVWQELAAFQRKFHQLPAKYWYNHIVKKKYKDTLIVARSERAKTFISQFSTNVSDIIIDHGVDTTLFHPLPKEKQFIIVGQLIERKQVNKSIQAFLDFCKRFDSTYVLKIAGSGDKLAELQDQVNRSSFSKNVVFLGKLDHENLAIELGKSIAMLVSTKKDDNMVSIPESLACGTPIITNSIPFSADYIQRDLFGIVKDEWGWDTLRDFINCQDLYISKCSNSSFSFGLKYKVSQFENVFFIKDFN
jgi:1,2-diacylglycerol 3-alpha-glucosyltransferase